MSISIVINPKEYFSFADEMLASDVSPLHWRKRKATMETLKDAISAVLYGNEPPQRIHWATIVDAVNVSESFLKLGYIDDPDGLHASVRDALAKAGQRIINNPDSELRVDAKGAVALDEFADAYEAMLEALPGRKVIRAYRKTDEYCQKVLRTNAGAADVLQELPNAS